MPVADLPLAGVCVLELAQGVSGPFCGKLMAEFGAQVTKVEPPTEDITRHRGPFACDQPDPEESLQYADVVITDQPILAPASILPVHHVIYTSIRPYGLDGPQADWPSTELTIQETLLTVLGNILILYSHLATFARSVDAPMRLAAAYPAPVAGFHAALATLLALLSASG